MCAEQNDTDRAGTGSDSDFSHPLENEVAHTHQQSDHSLPQRLIQE